MTSTITPALLEDLAAHSAATLHEAAPGSAVLPWNLRPAWPGAKLLGPAFTVAQAPGRNGWLHRAIYEAPRGSVLVVDTGDRGYGYWGELMSRAALECGLQGLVIHGGVRDVDAVEALGFPVFASAVCMRGTEKAPDEPGSLGRPLVLGDARIASGDVIVGDRDGVTVIPASDLHDLPARAAARERRETDVRKAIAGGGTLKDLVLSWTPARTASNATPDRTEPTDDLLVRLRRLDTCAVSDALDRLSLSGALPGFRRWGPPRRTAGRARTVELATGPGPAGGSHLGTRALADAGPDDVVVVANAGRAEAGCWGGLLTLEADLRRVAGIVLDGALRDVDEVDRLDVPVFAKGSTPRTARGRFHEVAGGTEVLVGGLAVSAGTFVLADGSGVVFVPEAEISRVLSLAEEIAGREARMAEELRQGHAGTAVMDSRYERMLEEARE